MTIPLEEWRNTVGKQLDLIGASAEMCARHARQLNVRPWFKTLAEEDLDDCEQALLSALLTVHLAKETYRSKEPEFYAPPDPDPE